MGGSEVLIVEQHINEVRLYDDIAPTLNTVGGGVDTCR